MGSILSTLRNTYFNLLALFHEMNTTKQSFDALISRVNDVALPIMSPSTTFWEDDPPFPELVNKQSENLSERADIVIIGSGIAGASFAYALIEQSRKLHGRQNWPRIVMLEARSICSGATGRNGGHIKCSHYHEYSSLKARYGMEAAKKLLKFQMRHHDILINFIRGCSYLELSGGRKVLTLDVFTDEEKWFQAKEMVQDLKRDMPEFGKEVLIYEGTVACKEHHIDPEHCCGIITYPAATLWPYRFVTSLYAILLEICPVFSIECNTPATEIDVTGSNPLRPFVVHTPRGKVHTTHIIHATDAFAANLLPNLTGKIFPVRGHMTAQKPGSLFPSLDGKKSWCFNHKKGFDYISQRPGSGMLMAGGGIVQSPEHGMDEFGIWTDDKSNYAIKAYLEGLLPTMFGPQNWGEDSGTRVQNSWTGCMGFTPDLLPFVGPLDVSITGRKLPQPLTCQRQPCEWICAGFQGEGMVLAWLSGVATALMLLGEEVDFQEMDAIPGGEVHDWLPEQLLCSKERVDRLNVSDLAGHL
ncbi:hypothetical protein N7495_003772 [Penicillium taxi]|uniref:uncharacterized protein n=1 Tax=Penicillium taxi TaxID=168475 RepID=UPI002545751B|nr:uncharacterized protein N7495_003772 [Penicillium taxi]KAJ5899028.1 hypothetical protein N7495_003772 [Penicillium taxi]